MIIDFNKKNNHHEYNERLKATNTELSEMSSKLFDLGLKLALTGKWKEWDDSVQVGTTVNFDEDMLLNTGDEIVTRLIKLSITLDDLIEDVDSKIKI